MFVFQFLELRESHMFYMRKHRLQIGQIGTNGVLREISPISKMLAIGALQVLVERHV